MSSPADGRPDFPSALAALQGSSALPVPVVAFDVLFLAGVDVRGHPYDERRQLLAGVMWPAGVAVSPSVDDGEALFEATKAAGMEGVVAKRRASPLRPGRSPHWVKVKHWRSGVFVATGVRRDGLVGLAVPEASTGEHRLLPAGAAMNTLPAADARALRAALREGLAPCVEVRFLEWTPQARLRHATCVRFLGELAGSTPACRTGAIQEAALTHTR